MLFTWSGKRLSSREEIYWNRTWPIYQIHYKANFGRFLLPWRNILFKFVYQWFQGSYWFFNRSVLNMVARERISNENNVNFILVNQRIKKILLKILKKIFLSFERWSVTAFTSFAKQILSKIVQKHKALAKN